MRGPLRRAVRRWREHLLDRCGLLYNRRFYRRSARHKGDSDQAVAATLLTRYQPRRVIDVGCGDGGVLAALQAAGVTVVGFERSRAALALCRRRGVPAVAADLRVVRPAPAEFDLALCCEVAEHLDPESGDALVVWLTQLAPRVVFSAAQPGQGGVRHLNEQGPDYWVSRFARHGTALASDETAALRQAWAALGVVDWLVGNVLVFERA